MVASVQVMESWDSMCVEAVKSSRATERKTVEERQWKARNDGESGLEQPLQKANLKQPQPRAKRHSKAHRPRIAGLLRLRLS